MEIHPHSGHRPIPPDLCVGGGGDIDVQYLRTTIHASPVLCTYMYVSKYIKRGEAYYGMLAAQKDHHFLNKL